MNRQIKLRLLIFLSIFTVISLVLSISISNFIPSPGNPSSSSFTDQLLDGKPGGVGQINISELFLRITVSLIFLGLLIFITVKMRGQKLGRDLLSYLFLALGIGAIIALFIFIFPDQPPAAPIDNGIPALEEQIESFEQPTAIPLLPKKILTILAWIAGILLAGFVIWIIIILIAKGEQKEDIFELIEKEAASTRESIETWGDLRNTIIRCYLNMCLILQNEQGIEREESMTVGEFEKRLNKIGIQGQAVRQLSGLFESARYGNWEPTADENTRAINSLDEIRNSISLLKKRESDEKK